MYLIIEYIENTFTCICELHTYMLIIYRKYRPKKVSCDTNFLSRPTIPSLFKQVRVTKFKRWYTYMVLIEGNVSPICRLQLIILIPTIRIDNTYPDDKKTKYIYLYIHNIYKYTWIMYKYIWTIYIYTYKIQDIHIYICIHICMNIYNIYDYMDVLPNDRESCVYASVTVCQKVSSTRLKGKIVIIFCQLWQSVGTTITEKKKITSVRPPIHTSP